jgi:hypothetical protein
MKVPFCLVEPGSFCRGLAEVVQEAGARKMAGKEDRRKDQGTFLGPGVLLQDLGEFFRRMGRCVLPNLSAKTHIAVLPGRGRAGA